MCSKLPSVIRLVSGRPVIWIQAALLHGLFFVPLFNIYSSKSYEIRGELETVCVWLEFVKVVWTLSLWNLWWGPFSRVELDSPEKNLLNCRLEVNLNPSVRQIGAEYCKRTWGLGLSTWHDFDWVHLSQCHPVWRPWVVPCPGNKP